MTFPPPDHSPLGAVVFGQHVSDPTIDGSWIGVSSEWPGVVYIVLNTTQKAKALATWPYSDGGVTVSADLRDVATYLEAIPPEHCEPWAEYLEQLAMTIRTNAGCR